MDKRALRWLYQELPELVSQGVVQPEVAERIRRHYGEPEAAGSTAKRWAILPFDKFFMEESKAPRAERAYWNNPNRRGQTSGQTYVLVRVKDGRGVIEDLFIDDQPIREFIETMPK